MTTATPEYAEYAKSVLAYEQTGYDAAQGGNLQGGIDVWSAILANGDMRAVFEQDPEAVKELAWNLALAHLGVGEAEKGDELVAQYGLDQARFTEAKEASQ